MKLDIANIISALRVDASRANLLEALTKIEQSGDQDSRTIQLKAEICYLLAKNYSSEDPVRSKGYAQQSKQFYKQIDIRKLEDAVPMLDWLLPSLMHEGVVERDFPSKGTGKIKSPKRSR